MKWFRLHGYGLGLLLIVSLTGPLRAGTPLAVELRPDLSYLPVRNLTEATPCLQATLAQPRAVVVDLRYASTDDAATTGLRSALGLHPAGTPLYFLLSPATPPDVVVAVNHTPGTCFTLSRTSAKSSARIQVKTDPESDRRAYEALAAGAAPDTLISGKIEKERFDEATLVQEFNNGNPDAEPPLAPDPTATKEPEEKAPAAPLVDRVLQRAVHLHQALIALRR
jgi:hypothetical protein